MRLQIASVLAGLLIAAGTAHGGVVSDAANDFLSTYTGVKGLDLDVRTTEATLDIVAGTLSVTTTVGANIGTTPTGFYVFGFNRGQGTQRFVTGTPSVGAGVSFDLVLILRPDGTGQVNDLIGGTSTPLAPGSVIISGSTISSAPLPLSLFPTRGFTPENYTFNLWPRVSNVSGNAAIPDFAPDASNAGLTIVPAPGAAVLLGGVVVALGGRRRTTRG